MYKSKIVNIEMRASCRFSKPDIHISGFRVDSAHRSDLVAFFIVVGLVNTDCVNPYCPFTKATPKTAKSEIEVVGNGQIVFLIEI